MRKGISVLFKPGKKYRLWGRKPCKYVFTVTSQLIPLLQSVILHYLLPPEEIIIYNCIIVYLGSFYLQMFGFIIQIHYKTGLFCNNKKV